MNRQKLAEKWGSYIPDYNIIPDTRTHSKDLIEVPSGFRRYVAVMPWPRQTLQLVKNLLDVKENEFGIPPQDILMLLSKYCQSCGLEVKFPQEWPENLEFNHLQANTFIDSVLTAAMNKVVPPATKILSGQALKLGMRTDPSFWLAENHPWLRLFAPEIGSLIDRESAGVWEVLLPKDGSKFDRPFLPDVRLALLKAKEYYQRQAQYILWQLSQNLSQDLGCFVWLAGQTTEEKPELVFQRIKGE